MAAADFETISDPWRPRSDEWLAAGAFEVRGAGEPAAADRGVPAVGDDVAAGDPRQPPGSGGGRRDELHLLAGAPSGGVGQPQKEANRRKLAEWLFDGEGAGAEADARARRRATRRCSGWSTAERRWATCSGGLPDVRRPARQAALGRQAAGLRGLHRADVRALSRRAVHQPGARPARSGGVAAAARLGQAGDRAGVLVRDVGDVDRAGRRARGEAAARPAARRPLRGPGARPGRRDPQGGRLGQPARRRRRPARTWSPTSARARSARAGTTGSTRRSTRRRSTTGAGGWSPTSWRSSSRSAHSTSSGSATRRWPATRSRRRRTSPSSSVSASGARPSGSGARRKSGRTGSRRAGGRSPRRPRRS